MSSLAQPAKLKPNAFSCSPFIKWAGGKNQLLPQLEKFFPKKFKAYHEPFIGSAAVFFHLRNTRGHFPATLSDFNEELVNCYQMVRDNLDSILGLLKDHKRSHCKDYYYAVRNLRPIELSNPERAARLIYLNKVCYNGLYRVNSKGEFNVPLGSYKNPRIFDEDEMREASFALKKAAIIAEDFSAVLDRAKRGDFVYFDPPYFTNSAGFTGYAVNATGRNKFGADEHYRLMEVVRELDRIGCIVVVSNSDTEFVRKIYRNFSLHKVNARRLINSNGNGRGPISELVVTNQ